MFVFSTYICASDAVEMRSIICHNLATDTLMY